MNNFTKIIVCSLKSAITFGSFYIFKLIDKNIKINISNYFYKNLEKLRDERPFLYLEGFNLEYRAFYVACAVEQNVNILLQIIQQCNIDINKTDMKGNDGFIIACCKNRNLQIIQFLATFPNQDIHKKNIYQNNAFSLACEFNDNLKIIQFLAEIYDFLNVNKNNSYKINAIHLACNNNNINVIKYLVEITNLYLKSVSRQLFNACFINKNLEIMLYLIEDLRINITELNFYKKIRKYNIQ